MGERYSALRSILHTKLMRLPSRFLLAAAACFALDLASDLGNSFATAPHFGGPLVAWATFIMFLLVFAFGVGVTVRGVAPPPSPRVACSARSSSLPPAQALPILTNGEGESQQFRGLPWGAQRLRALRVTSFLVKPLAPLRRWLATGAWRPWVIYPLLVWALWTGVQSLRVVAQMPATLASPSHYGSDELYFAQYNAWLVLHGQNPYVGDRLAATLRYFQSTSVTPLRVGAYSDPLRPPTKAQLDAIVAGYLADPAAPHPQLETATTHSYPALSFLLALPSVWVGLPTLGYVQVLALLALVIALVMLSPPPWRLAVLALCLLDVDGIRSVAGSDFAIWTAAGVALVWLLRAQRWGAALALGLVCAVQQTAWFAAPFYLVWVLHRRGWRAAVGEGALAVAAFIAINLPWIVASPAALVHSLVLPMTLPLFPTGGGLVGLGLGGALPLWPPIVYTILEFGCYFVLLAAYARLLPYAPYAGIVLPTLTLLLAWRSPSRYFILLPFLVIVALLLTWKDAMPAAMSDIDAQKSEAMP